MQMLWLKSLQKQIIGNVFETGMFNELVKKYTKDNIYFWRTKDKKEIDFIVKDKNTILPIEAKLNFSRADLAPINYFSKHYKPKKYIIAGFDGKKTQKEHRYPWEMI